MHAEFFLKRQGLTTITRRYQRKTGEIDLIMNDNCHLVFIEVRYRKRQDYGSGVESINHTKISKIERTLQCFCSENNIIQKNLRIDVISMSGNIIKPNIEWIKNIN
ncbi:MAG: YraN family protein [Legionellales bacterium]|jgi:putative endonuclease|nr:YraN family protein [Legionellales bacterium]